MEPKIIEKQGTTYIINDPSQIPTEVLIDNIRASAGETDDPEISEDNLATQQDIDRLFNTKAANVSIPNVYRFGA